MGLAKLTKSRGYKNFMSKLYGIGAAVVILGALFKINHYQGADLMLILGLSTESIIFFFSAFEPPHVEPDWSLVYPELAGLYHGQADATVKTQGAPSSELDKMLADANIDSALIDSLGQGLSKLSNNTEKLSDLAIVGEATDEFASNLKTASQSVESLSSSYQNQDEALKKELELSTELSATVKGANESINGLSEAYKKASEEMSKDLSVTEAFAKSIQETTNNTNALNEHYQKAVGILAESANALDFSALKENKYNEELDKLSSNLASLNSAYELQLQQSKTQADAANQLNEGITKLMETLSGGAENTITYQEKLAALNKAFDQQLNNATQQAESSENVKKSLDDFLAKLNESAEKTVQYNSGLEELHQKVASLNQVYGNMLSAMNVKS